MNVLFAGDAFEQFMEFVAFDRKLALKTQKLIEDISRHPFEGLGKPEPLRHELSGCWSRRITDEHRLVYKVENNTIKIVQCKFHYHQH